VSWSRPSDNASADSEPERWQRIQELFHQTLEREPPERDRFLAAACGDHADLEAEVRDLIAAGDGAGGRIERAIHGTFELAAADRGATRAKLRIGPYQVLRQVGRGGMSTVYLAERADEHYRKRVAIKVVRRGMDTQDILSRLRRERQILAALDHPLIARLLDGGNTGDGLPYFVMEYIDGEPIDRYCDRRRLTISRRLELFRDVCSAVQYAHRNLVIHRDIKPSNLLVTADGVPKLLDFGIAKLLDPELSAPTATGMRLLTPEYASPEQVRGEPLTTATDVYSLGVLLYELLTGRRAYRVDGARGRELERLICEVEPERPSAALTRAGKDAAAPTPETVAARRGDRPERLRRRLAGDLDTIVLTALNKEPQRRYPSVEQLSEDVRRHLERLPVVTRRDTLGYRVGKFLRRHRLAVAAAAAMGLVVAALVSFYTARLTAERDRAQAEERKSAQVAALLTGLFEGSDPGRARGDEVTARELLDLGARKIETGLRDQPGVRSEMMDLIGGIYRRLGYYEAAEPLVGEALEIRRRLHGPEHPDVASSLASLGNLRYDQGRYGEAEELFRQSLEIRRRHLGGEAPEVAASLNDLAAALYERGRFDRAEEMYRQALEMRRRLLGEGSPEVAVSLSGLASVLDRQGRGEEAEDLYRRALEIRRRLYGPVHPDLALSLNNLAALLTDRGDYAAAERMLREVAEMEAKLFGEEHPNAALNLHNLAEALRRRGDLAAAERTFVEALETSRRVRGPGHREEAFILRKLGDLLRQAGRSAEAEERYLEALALERRHAPEGDWRTSYPLFGLGAIYLERGDPRSAEPLLREAVEIRRRERAGHWRTAEAESALGACLAALGRYGEAEPLLVGSYPVLLAELGAGEPRVESARRRVIELYDAWGRPQEGLRFRRRYPGPTDTEPPGSSPPN
jgi:serine/threonine-protein kinase